MARAADSADPDPGAGSGSGAGSAPAVEAVATVRRYGGRGGAAAVVALDGVSVAFGRARWTAIMGPSGSGKSTLLHCLAGLDRLTSGRVAVGGVDLATLRDGELTRLRRERIGFVFQTFSLVPSMSVRDNITLPQRLGRRRVDEQWLTAVVELVGLGDRLAHRPAELSGGQRQRVAVARALVGRPEVIFADEPTGNLDTRSGDDVLRLLREAVAELGQTVIMVTHDPAAAARTDRVLFLADGRLRSELTRPTPRAVLDTMERLTSGAGS